MEIQEEPIFFCLLDYFYGQKRPQNAINEVYPAISPPGVSKLVVLRGSRLDLSRKHPGRCVGTIFRIWNCHRGAPECPKSASKCHEWGWSKSIVLENKVAINFDFRSGAKKSGHLDYPLQSYGPKQVIKNHAWWWLVKIFKFRWFLGPSAIKKSRLFAQPSYLSTLKPIKHFSGSFNFFPKVSRDTSQ